jgi:dTDP-L-rhamnose 4-epimerase
MSKILISGGAGFIGSNAAKKLLAKGHEVAILDNLSPQIHGSDPAGSPTYASIRNECEVIIGDVRNEGDWVKALDGKDSVVHLAAETGTGQSMYEIKRYSDVNISGTSILLDLIGRGKLPVERLVIASSRAIYGEGKYSCAEHGVQYPGQRELGDMKAGKFNPLCRSCGREMDAMATDEASRPSPTSVYGITKHVQEQLALMFGATTGMPVTALRFQNVYGPGQSLKNPYTGILSIFSTAMLHGNPIEIFEDGKESRDFVFIDDVVDAIVIALEKEGIANAAYNVGSGRPVSVLEVTRNLKSLLGSKSDVRVGGKCRVGDIRHNYADLELSHRRLGFEPRVGFEEGVGRFAEWVRAQTTNPDGYMDSLSELKAKGLLK